MLAVCFLKKDFALLMFALPCVFPSISQIFSALLRITGGTNCKRKA